MSATVSTKGGSHPPERRLRLFSIGDRAPELAALALAVIIGLTVWLGMRYVDQTNWVRHTLRIETKIAQIWSSLQDAEIGQRSYLLTGADKFLAPYIGVEERISTELDALGDLVVDNLRQVRAIAELRPLVRQRLDFAASTIAQRQQGEVEKARSMVLEGRGFELIQDLRVRFQRLAEEEERLLEARTSAAQNTIIALSAVILLALAGTLYVLIAWVRNTRQAARALSLANTNLRETIQQREEAEQQVRQMQKMETIGQLAGGIAHDFNNMLAVIISGISLARRRLADDRAGAEEFLAGALEGAQRAGTLVNRLLAFARQQPLAPQPIDANKFVAGMSELIARALGETVHMETILGGGLWPTQADPAQLESSILNLCVNARDAMPEGGRLTLETANCHLDDRYSRLHPDVPAGQYVLIAVTDTGAGMAPEVAAKAFEPFFTTKATGKGTGLGLSQVFGFVKQSGGHIKIYSEQGQGTTVKIYLPRYFGEAETAVSTSAVLEEFRGTESILLVEDDASVLTMTAAGLRDLGYRVSEARHPKEALAALRQGEEIDLLLTDIVMPDMNGRKLAEEASVLVPGLRILFMTGFTKNAVVHNGVLDRGVHFLAKPFTLDELSRKVREALDTKSQ